MPAEITWTRVDSSNGVVPAPRWRHSACAISGTKLVVFGGFHNSTTRLNDIWVWDTTSKSWSQPVTATHTSSDTISFSERKKAATPAFKPVHLAAIKTRAEEEEKKGDRSGPGVVSGPSGSSAFLEELGVPLDDPKAADANPDAPTPRGAHSAVVVSDHMVVFGGYGGVGYQRKDFNDLYRLHIPTMSWAKTDPASITGEPPAARSGHVAMTCKKLMLVFGGWSATAQYNDLWSFNTETMAWAQIHSATFGSPRWNHCGLSVVAVPNWQLFVWGGSGSASDDETAAAGDKGKDKGNYLGDMLVLDTGDFKWRSLSGGNGDRDVLAGGVPPKARADAAMVYDPAYKRIITFGGWANRWFGDAHALAVTPVVGPPYAVLGIKPSIGPITGNQKVTIMGMGFEPNQSAMVRFTTGKKFVEAAGTAVSDTEVVVTTPSYENVGPGTVEVRASLRGGLLTITKQQYSFFHVTDSKYSFAFGPGLLHGLVANVPTSFYIQARDTVNADRQTGTDEFVVSIAHHPAAPAPVDADAPPAPAPAPVPVEGVTVKDEDNGRYLVTYTAPVAGKYKIDVSFAGTYGGSAGPVRGSTFTATFVAEGNKEANKLSGAAVWDHAKALVDQAEKISRTTLDGITKEVPHDNLEVLLAVKNHLANVTSKDPEVRLMLDQAAAMLVAMKHEGARKGKEVETLQSRLDKASETWEDCHKQAPKCKAAIAPLVKTTSSNIRKDVEAFEAQTMEYAKKTESDAYWKFETGYEDALKALENGATAHKAHNVHVERKLHLATTFEFPQAMAETLRAMKEVQTDMDEMRKLWALAKEAREFFAQARQQLWSAVKPEDLEDGTKGIQKRLKAGGNKKTRQSGAYKGLDKQIRDFLTVTPLIVALGHKSMRPRHWQLLMKATKKQFTPPYEDPKMKMQAILDLSLHEFIADVEEICDQALKEEKMEDTLRKLDETWKAVQWLSESYKEGSSVKLLKLGEEDFESLEADQLAVQGMMASRYLATFEAEVTGWQKGLSMVAEVVLLLSDIQRKWSYLEPLFIGSEEVRRELPEDAARFEAIDKGVKSNLAEMLATGNVNKACNKAGLFKELEKLSSELDLCEKSLADFLNGKRRQFPRFYFVSKTDLLDILSNGSNPRRILSHVTKVFLQTDTLILEGGTGANERPTATKFTAAVGVEEIIFAPAVPLEGKVEIYLQTVLDAQRATLKYTLARSVERVGKQQRIEWLMNKDENKKPSDPAQISLLVSGMEYVKCVEKGFDGLEAGNEKALQEAFDKSVLDLADLVRLTQTNLSKPDRTRVMCMITLDAHGRDIIQKMILEGVREKKAFQWQSQLKQRWIDNDARMQIADARFEYSYEYLGNGPRLVVTPLTDRIYVTATQALNLKMGCAPAGPAGTGKTETTKDLANALAIACYVFSECRAFYAPRVSFHPSSPPPSPCLQTALLRWTT